MSHGSRLDINYPFNRVPKQLIIVLFRSRFLQFVSDWKVNQPLAISWKWWCDTHNYITTSSYISFGHECHYRHGFNKNNKSQRASLACHFMFYATLQMVAGSHFVAHGVYHVCIVMEDTYTDTNNHIKTTTCLGEANLRQISLNITRIGTAVKKIPFKIYNCYAALRFPIDYVC